MIDDFGLRSAVASGYTEPSNHRQMLLFPKHKQKNGFLERKQNSKTRKRNKYGMSLTFLIYLLDVDCYYENGYIN